MAKTQTVDIKIEGLKEVQAALRKLPPEAKEKLVDASWEISQDLAKAIRSRARTLPHQAPLLASTVATGEKEQPSVIVGGTAPLGRHAKPAYKLLFGAEFGATFLRQFMPRNTEGYFIYPTVREEQDGFVKKWLDAANAAIDNFGGG